MPEAPHRQNRSLPVCGMRLGVELGGIRLKAQGGPDNTRPWLKIPLLEDDFILRLCGFPGDIKQRNLRSDFGGRGRSKRSRQKAGTVV